MCSDNGPSYVRYIYVDLMKQTVPLIPPNSFTVNIGDWNILYNWLMKFKNSARHLWMLNWVIVNYMKNKGWEDEEIKYLLQLIFFTIYNNGCNLLIHENQNTCKYCWYERKQCRPKRITVKRWYVPSAPFPCRLKCNDLLLFERKFCS